MRSDFKLKRACDSGSMDEEDDDMMKMREIVRKCKQVWWKISIGTWIGFVVQREKKGPTSDGRLYIKNYVLEILFHAL